MRCNIIDVSFLTDQHLIAERNELRFIPPLLKKKYHKKRTNLFLDVPKNFCLGVGHMNFWLDKMEYLDKRYNLLTEEMLARGFNPNPEVRFFTGLAKSIGAYNDWTPEEKDYEIIKERIKDRILLKFSWYKIYSKPISIDWFVSKYGEKNGVYSQVSG